MSIQSYRNQYNEPRGWFSWTSNLITAGISAAGVLRRLEQAWNAGQIARERYEQIKNIASEIIEEGRQITDEIREQLNELYEQGRREIEGPREQARIQRQERQITTQQPNEISTRAPRRNPSTYQPPATTTPNPTPTPATAQPSTGKAHLSIYYGTNK